jgi:hypothetical protein
MLQDDLTTTMTTSFRFDRPSQHGLGAKTAGDGVMEDPEAVEAIADRVVDEIMRHLDPSDTTHC